MRKNRIRNIVIVLLSLINIPFQNGVLASNSITPGELFVERSTLISVGFEWRVDGDDNNNASCKVQYRKAGNAEWKNYLPLFRFGMGLSIPNSMLSRGESYLLHNALAGSIMDLEPGTSYEVQLEILDADGVIGEAIKTVTVTTRSEPVVPEAGIVRHVYPPDYTGIKESPHYVNIMDAVNGYPMKDNVYRTNHPNVAPPGTIIKLHAGTYKYNRNVMRENNEAVYHYGKQGTIYLNANGTAESPIYIVNAGDGDVIFDGDGCHILFNVRSSDYLHFEGIKIINTQIAFFCGFQGERGGGCKGLTVKGCYAENIIFGVLAQDGRSVDFNILDNVFIGANPAKQLGKFGSTTAGYAVNLSGQGHAVGYNYVSNFWDGINVFTGALANPADSQQARAIDFYNNEVFNTSDQFIESDGGFTNIRMLRNLCFNNPSQPISSQPVHAGPVYWIRNIIWNVNKGDGCFKIDHGAPVFVFLHNTSSAHIKMAYNNGRASQYNTFLVQNNLCIGPAYADGTTSKYFVEYADGIQKERQNINNNAFNINAAGASCKIGKTTYSNFSDMKTATQFDMNSILVDGYSIFENAPEPPHAKARTSLVFPADINLSLKSGTKPVDAGIIIPGINDDYNGTAPDIGAYETGKPIPQYGPRINIYKQK